ncbi:serine hydrolase domain-containing protein [Streptomyces sp. HUAS TT7]|uniref:serine hydrolase domain-containing protein n=1 Tax=Streptomyces sp. HUAS TT7 TaxID=3447507 RepID=UPI003F65E521
MAARWMARRAAVALVAGAVVVSAFAAPAGAASSGGTARGEGHRATQRVMDTIVKAGIPGITAQARDRKGVWRSTSGVGDRATGQPRGVDDRFRVASMTKTFVATVLLQQEAEGKVGLDDRVERWLPGVVRGNGNDGRRISVRQLLNHTSGIYDYLADPGYLKKYVEAPGFLRHRYDTVTPDLAVRTALSHRPSFEPGARYGYSNTNYVLSALIMERVGGRSYEDEVRTRIIEPLGLRGTVLPGNSVDVPKPSSRAYSTLSADPDATKIYDVTRQNASQSWGDGDIISTAADLNRFYSALIRGELLPAEQLAEMKTTIPHPQKPGYRYGLGIATYTTDCGVRVWGHDGGWLGSLSGAVTTEDGLHTLAFNLNADWGVPDSVDTNIVKAEFC